MAQLITCILLRLFIAAAPSILSSDFRIQQATNFISAKSPTMWRSSHPLVTPVNTSELLNWRVQKKGMLSTGNFFPAMFNPATDPWQMAQLQCSIRAGAPVYQKGQDAISPAAQTSFWFVYKKMFVFRPPSSFSMPFAKSTAGYTPEATISTSVGISPSQRVTAWTNPYPSICFTLALVTTLIPFFQANFCRTEPILSPRMCDSGVFLPYSTVTLRSLLVSLMEEANYMPINPPPTMVMFLTAGALMAVLISIQSFLFLREKKLTSESPLILGTLFLTPDAIKSLSYGRDSLPSICTFLFQQSISVTLDDFTTMMPLFYSAY